MDKAKDFEKGWEECKAKKKQEIEEMIGIIQNAVGGCAEHWAKLIAEELHKNRYRKITENAVVLTREEYEWLTCCFGKFEEIMNDIKEQSRKETAEKFAERLKEKAHWFLNNEIQKDHFCECLDEICKGIIGEEK